jgi:hypothetical protein
VTTILVILGIVICLGVLVGGAIIFLPDLLPDDFGGTTTTTTGSQTIVDVENQMDVDICAIYISYASSSDWGNNLLTSGQTIPPYNYVSFYVDVGETIDILASDCSGNEIDSLFDVYIPAEGLTVTYSPNY